MKNANMMEVLVGLKKSGTEVYLTAEGIQEFMKLMQEDMVEVKNKVENAV
jgi:hypothetical protein